VVADIRAAMHRLAVNKVPPEDEVRYRANLAGRLGYLSSVDARDAASLRDYAKRLKLRLK
jgi:hypothetical protein